MNDSMPLWKTTTRPELLSWNLFWRQFQYPARAVKDKRQINPALLRLHWSVSTDLPGLPLHQHKQQRTHKLPPGNALSLFKSAADGAGTRDFKGYRRELTIAAKKVPSPAITGQRVRLGLGLLLHKAGSLTHCTRLTHVPRRSSPLLLH